MSCELGPEGLPAASTFVQVAPASGHTRENSVEAGDAALRPFPKPRWILAMVAVAVAIAVAGPAQAASLRHHKQAQSHTRHRKARAPFHKSPDTTLVDGPSNTVTTRSASFSFTSNVRASRFECRLDGGTWSSCSDPKALSGLTEGTHTFAVRAVYKGIVDAAPAARKWTVAAPPPPPTVTTTPTTTTMDPAPDTTTTTTTPTPTTTASTTPAPAPVPSAGPCFTADPAHTTATPQATWRPVGSLPLSDVDAAALVTPVVERRSDNATPNHYCASDSDLSLYHSARDNYGDSEANLGSTFNPYHRYVTGRFVGTTDEIIEWAGHKWGIPEDALRAQYVNESWWHQSAKGDQRTVADPLLYPAFSRIAGTSDVFESVGLTQVRWRPDDSANAGTEPLRWESTAFNVDYQASIVRFYYDDPLGHRTNWGDSTYVKGNPWLSIGGWYSPYPWNNAGQQSYVASVQNELANRTWERAGF